MVARTARATALPRLEPLETRATPATLLTESFDLAVAGALPRGWASWSDGVNTLAAVTADRSQSAAQGFAVTAAVTSGAGRAWPTRVYTTDAQIGAEVFLSNLVPAQLFARGTNLDGARPSYYALSVTRGLQVQLLHVTDGQPRVLAQMSSTSWTTNLWVRATLSVVGTTLRAQVFRLDTAEYLRPDGSWQEGPTWALEVRDTSLRTAGRVGVAKPAGLAGVAAFDDFVVTTGTGDTRAPTIRVEAPVDRTWTGTVPINAVIAEDVAVAKVEYYLDGVRRYVARAAPYRWDFDTSIAANGSHTLVVIAYDVAGNVRQSSRLVTTQNALALQAPAIPRHYTHIRLAQLAYSGNPLGEFEDRLLRESVDLVIPGPQSTFDHIQEVAPNTPQLLYTNVSSLYRDLLSDWVDYADRRGADPESAFFHVVNATPFSGNSPSSTPVTWFWSVVRGGGATPLQLTERARSTSATNTFALGGVGEWLAVGHPDRFREVNVEVALPAGLGWTAELEYPRAVDAAGNPTDWGRLTPVADGTAGLTRSGTVAFDPPTDWQPAVVEGSRRLYFVRWRTTSAGVAPTLRRVLGRDYVGAAGGTTGVVPAFDRGADANGDGYLNDAEYARRAAGKDARFFHESRALSHYGQLRPVTNLADPVFRAWAVDYNRRLLASQPLADGLFIDNALGLTTIKPTGAVVHESTAAYDERYAELVQQLAAELAPKWILVNTGGGGTAADAIVRRAHGYFEEFMIRPLAHNVKQFEDFAAQVKRRMALQAPAPYAVFDSTPQGGDVLDPRTQLATLAYYYLLHDPQRTFLDLFGGTEPASTWQRHWFDAVAHDIGQPKGTWSIFATGADPENANLTYKVYQRSFDNALVLYKPRSGSGSTAGTTADATVTEHQLARSYRPLRADGTLGEPTRSVRLRNGEGAILIPA